MKYLKIFFVGLIFSILSCVCAFGTEIYVDGNALDTDAILIDGTCFVPLRGVFEKLGFTVGYDSITETAYIKSEDTEIVIKNGQYRFTVNDRIVYPSKAQRIIGSVFYIPLRSVAESIGAEVVWDNGDVYINSKHEEEIAEETSAYAEYAGKSLYLKANDNIKEESEKSYIYKSENGYYLVTAGNGEICINEVDCDFKSISNNIIKYDLPLFGGYYYDGNYHYVVTGSQIDDPYSDDSVYKIQQYDKSFTLFHERKLSAKYSGINIPFVDRNVQFYSNEKIIYILDSCKRFTTNSPNSFQGDYIIALNIKDFSVVSKGIVNEIENSGGLYRNFRAYACNAVENKIAVCAVKQGENPYIFIKNAVNTAVCNAKGINIYSVYNSSSSDALRIFGFDNLGGNYVVVGVSVPQYDGKNNKNIFAASVPENDLKASSAKIRWISEYSDKTEIKISNVKCKKINENKIFILWEEEEKGKTTVKGVEIDENGEVLKRIFSDDYLKLSNCDLYCAGNEIIWFCSDEDNETTYLYKIDIL